MSTFRLAVGLHNHQPIGNFEAVFEEAHRRAYLPFLTLLEKHPSIRLSLHQSGILWSWQEHTRPEYFELVGRLVDNRQVELMTGGFYEPILSSIPERDARGQIAMLTDYLRDHFGIEPRGLWLTERIWEPHMPLMLAESGVEYLPIDDTHFVYAGMELSQLTGPFVTENEGKCITLLPIQKRLRYLIPFGTVEEVMDNLKRQAERDPDGTAVYADDGEKFGVWPDTYQHCYEDNWLEDFFTAVEKNSDWLEVVPLGEIAQEPPVGRAYLPTASYSEMLHWSLPPQAFLEYEGFEHWLKDHEMLERYGRFVRGGHWRGFLAKYEESNLMHKKMLAVSDRLKALADADPGHPERTALARDRLFAGQCNCPYWHGVFGGLYLPHIRKAIYANLIEADNLLEKIAGEPPVRVIGRDYDCDGHEEIIARTPAFTAIFKPDRGGALQELSLNRHNFSVTDTLTRRREGYHIKLERAVLAFGPRNKSASIHDQILTKEIGLERFLVDDWYLKRCFIDHFLSGEISAEKFATGAFRDEGDFTLEPFWWQAEPGGREITLTRDGRLWRSGGQVDVRLVKRFRFIENDDRIAVRYELTAPNVESILVNFAIEQNFTFQAGHAEDRFITIDGVRPEKGFLDAAGTHRDVRAWGMVDQWQQLAVGITSERPCEVWHSPIFTVSLSEGGFERVYQGTTMVNLFLLRLTPEPTVIDLELHAGALSALPDAVVGGVAAGTAV